MQGIYVDPEGKEYPVEEAHVRWIKKNVDLLRKYIGIDKIIKERQGNWDNIWSDATVELLKKGWWSASLVAYPSEVHINIGNPNKLSEIEDWLTMNFQFVNAVIYVLDDGISLETEWPIPSGDRLTDVYKYEQKKKSLGIEGIYLSYREMLKTALGPGDFYGFYALSLIPPSYWKENPYAASQAAELLNTMFEAYAPKVEYGIVGELYNAYKHYALDYNDYLDAAQKKNWRHVEAIFEDGDIWKGVLKGYGGKKWANITRLYIDMKEAFPVNPDDLARGFILLDRIHDIEHNTNAMLAEHYQWMGEALDFKAEAEPAEVAARASDFYRRIISESGVLGNVALTQREAIDAEKKKIS